MDKRGALRPEPRLCRELSDRNRRRCLRRHGRERRFRARPAGRRGASGDRGGPARLHQGHSAAVPGLRAAAGDARGSGRKGEPSADRAPDARRGSRPIATSATRPSSCRAGSNGRFADLDWTPIRYIHRAVPRERIAHLFRQAAVGLVTPPGRRNEPRGQGICRGTGPGRSRRPRAVRPPPPPPPPFSPARPSRWKRR